MSDDIQARTTTEAQLIERAMKDPAFRAELIADPKAVFARDLGLEMPGSVDIQVVEETPTTVHLVLPQAVPDVGAELSDVDLANVAGGWSAATQECAATCGPCGSQAPNQTCPLDSCGAN